MNSVFSSAEKNILLQAAGFRLNTVSVSLAARFAQQTLVKVVCFPSTLLTSSCARRKARQFFLLRFFYIFPRNMDRGLAWSVIPIAGILLWTLQLLARAAWTGSALSQVLSR